MKSLSLLVAFCVVLFPITTCTSQLLTDTIKSIQQKLQSNDRQCNATISGRQLFQCSVNPLDGVLPEGTVCTYNSKKNTTEIFICDHGYFIYGNHDRTGTRTAHNREKRLFLAGLLVGIAVGIAVGVAIACVIMCRQGHGQPGPQIQYVRNEPPTIDCPKDPIIRTAGKQEDSVIVKWEEPHATDKEGKLKKGSPKQIFGEPSGSAFENGQHTIVYEASDDVGNKDLCTILINITVIMCNVAKSPYLDNGQLHCERLQPVYGDNCTYSCKDGYEISSNATVTCEQTGNSSDGQWMTYNNISCNRKQCDPPETLCNGFFRCSNENYFGSVCFPTCNDGYSTKITRSIVCDGDTWVGMETIVPCTDIDPPMIACPSDFQTFSDANGTAIVSWESPVVTDNSESDECAEPVIKLTQTSGNISGAAFDIGYHVIEYEASGKSKNSRKCQFAVVVEQMSCEPLTVSDRFLLTRCDDGFSLGAVCTFSCFLSYGMVGRPNVTCVKDPENNNHVTWDWSNRNETYCEKLSCPDLPAPAGGALACSSALGNKLCTMSCSIDYRVPLGTSTEYVCSDEQVWTPGIPPNCTDAVHPLDAILPGELFYYYEGDCANETVQGGIKDNFVQVMESLEGTEGWGNVCPEYCTVNGVTVTCGPLNGRKKKRSLAHYLVKRATQEITISFNVQSRWQSDKDLWGNDDDIHLLSNLIQEQVSNGNLSVPEMTTGTMNFGWIEMSCPTGLVPKYERDSACDGCAPGKYLKDGSCHECEKGTFQDQEYQTNCTVCPDGKSTETTGATSLNQCEDKCVPGTYSTTGVVPCTPCALGHYQTEFEATSCTPCDPLKFTTSVGSTDESNCKVLDMAFTSKDSDILLNPLEVNVTSFTSALWMKCSNSSRRSLVVSFGSLSFSYGYEITFTVTSYNFSEDVISRIDLTKWTHLAVSSDSTTKTVLMYGNGVKLASFDLSKAITVPVGSRLSLQSRAIGCIVSGFYMVGNILTHSVIESQSKVCQSSLSGTLYSMNSVYKAERNDIQFPLTSCDAVDECLSNPCKTGNICMNKVGGFVCVCTRGYSGSTCQIPPDLCINNDCKRDSTCVSHFSTYTCECPADFTGIHCENKIEHGNWGPWLNTSECSVTCNGGVRTRERFCNNPKPDSYGRYCVGSNVSTVTCNEDPCPECDPWYTIKQYKNEFNCTTVDGVISCVVTCQQGFSFVKDYYPLEVYNCGPETSYKWRSKPPPCAPVYHAVSLATTSMVSYEIDCESKDSFSSQLSNTLSQLRCVTNGTCDVETSVSGCSGSGKKRSLNRMQVTINLLSDLSSVGDLQLDDFYANNIVSSGLLEMIQIYIDMDQTLYQMNSTGILTVDDNGVLFEADLSTFTFTINVTCLDGKVEEDMMCVDCPSGTYWKTRFCVLCPEGTYQNQSGQTQCTQCPTGYTTNFIGSQDVADCNVLDNSTRSSSKNEEDEDGKNKIVIIGVVLGTVVLVAAVIIMVTVMKKRHDRNIRFKSTMGSARSIQSTSKVHPVILDYYDAPPRYVCVPPKSGSFRNEH